MKSQSLGILARRKQKSSTCPTLPCIDEETGVARLGDLPKSRSRLLPQVSTPHLKSVSDKLTSHGCPGEGWGVGGGRAGDPWMESVPEAKVVLLATSS